MIYLCHGEKSAASNMKATEACESFKSMTDQRSKSLSTLFLNTETVSYGSGYAAAVAVGFLCSFFLHRNIMAIVLSGTICLFTQPKLQKAHKVERGHEPFIPMKG